MKYLLILTTAALLAGCPEATTERTHASDECVVLKYFLNKARPWRTRFRGPLLPARLYSRCIADCSGHGPGDC
jgi:hypothetical protein